MMVILHGGPLDGSEVNWLPHPRIGRPANERAFEWHGTQQYYLLRADGNVADYDGQTKR